jgi:ATP-dependent Clp protease ATP-binding subunit ClpA
LLFLGPTGSGKTHVVEAAAECLFRSRDAVVKINCAEFQHSHEIAKLTGSPPGYLGHRDTAPLLTQEKLDEHQTERNPFTLVLFDEIEKASNALWRLLLGVLDKAKLTLGDNREVDFSQTLIVMTSNLGAAEMAQLITGSIGFAPAKGKTLPPERLDDKIDKTATDAARRKFSPEFMNRLDQLVVFRSLKTTDLQRILELELNAVQHRIQDKAKQPFYFRVTDPAKARLLEQGINPVYGARHLKRTIEKLVVEPLARLSASGQVRRGEVVVIDYDRGRRDKELSFFLDVAESAKATGATRVAAQPARGQAA